MPLTFLWPATPSIFISYRREDTESIIGRIDDHLSEQFGRDHVFRDTQIITPGSDFEGAINDALAHCDVLLAVIGPRWAGASKIGTRKIFEPSDVMRAEIEFALAKGMFVIPVLIDQTSMPTSHELPDSIRGLARLQAARVRTDDDFKAHMKRLIVVIEQNTDRGPLRAILRPLERHPLASLAGTALAAVVILTAYFALEREAGEDSKIQAAVQACNRSLTIRCAQAGGVFGAVNALSAIRACNVPILIRSDEPALRWKDIWTTSVFSYQPGGGGPGGGKDDDVLKVGGWGDWYFSLIQFSLPPVQRKPQFAALALYSKESEGASVPINIDRLISRWDFPKGGTLWWKDRPGQRAVTTDPLPAPKKEQWYIIDVTLLVHDWMDGKSENFGLQIRPAHDFGSFVFFVSSDAPDKSKIPRLVYCD